jgi:hypothetical protein
MRGGLFIVRQNGDIETRSIDRPPTAEELREIVSGYIEMIPYWTHLSVASKNIDSDCVGFCDSDGKTIGNKLSNELATAIWEVDLNRKGMSAKGRDYLVGDIVLVWGDQELLDNL